MGTESRPLPTKKFHKRQDEILRVAVRLMNARGVKGMTLSQVAAELDQVPTSVMYYFRSKEALAAACVLKSLEVYEGLIAAAMPAATAQEGIEIFVRGYFDLRRRIAIGEHDPIATFNDVRALADPTVGAAYVQMFKHARELLLKSNSMAILPRYDVNARTHLLLSELFWVVVWARRYEPDDYPRLADHMLAVFEQGLSKQSGTWSPRTLAVPAPTGSDKSASDKSAMSRETFLRAATALMNERGYLGASVQKISERLNVTKGAFYHHHDAKDDLVSACFARTFEIMRHAQSEAGRVSANANEYLTAAASTLLEGHMSGHWPLLRSSALTSVPQSICDELIREFERITARFQLTITDGIVDGSLRPVDATIAAQMLTALTNAAVELPWWAPGTTAENVGQVFARPFFEGLLVR